MVPPEALGEAFSCPSGFWGHQASLGLWPCHPILRLCGPVAVSSLGLCLLL